MNKSVFDYESYKLYLSDFIRKQPKGGRGFKAYLSDKMDCQGAYLSRVLNGDAHLSAEQAQKANAVLGHGKVEGRFFLLLVFHARAGTTELKAEFEEQMKEIIQKQLILKNRLNVKQTLTREDQSVYYSAWYFTAVHFLATISNFQSSRTIAERLGLTYEKVDSILDFLVSVGLVIKEGQTFKAGTLRIHLENDSPMISKHHTNWRMRAIDSFDKESNDSLHYSSVITIAKKDAMKIKATLVKAIEEVRATVKESKEEDLFCYSLDFFKV